ncbi:FCD domain-containing protein, partial [Mycobacterium tuberculosis]|nr:FCD domain-containing protein [Mycobacterium tuberculosis]
MGGTFVNGPSLEEARADLAATTTMLVGMGQFSLDEIAAVRLSLETLCARLAAVHRSDADLAALADEIALQATTDLTDVEFCASDVRFHRRLADQEGARDAGERQAGDDAQRAEDDHQDGDALGEAVDADREPGFAAVALLAARHEPVVLGLEARRLQR